MPIRDTNTPQVGILSGIRKIYMPRCMHLDGPVVMILMLTMIGDMGQFICVFEARYLHRRPPPLSRPTHP
jgi:hypothetical protein